jgi:hypothetical protein
MGNPKVFVVAVFENPPRREGLKPRYMAYTRYFNTAWEGCCIHRVNAESGAAAKHEAIMCHKMKRGCQADE